MSRKYYAGYYTDTGDPTVWMLPHGNLMLVLMVFFMVLFAAVQMTPLEYLVAITGYAGESAKGDAKIKLQYSLTELNLAMELNEKLKGQTERIKVTKEEIRLVLRSPVLFDSGSAELKPSALGILNEISEQLKTIKNPVVVEGHTDNIPLSEGGVYRSNWELSAARAFSVIKYFIDKPGYSADSENIEEYASRFSAMGCAQWQPYNRNKTVRENNADEEGRAKSRRIEIIILRGEQK